MFYLTTLLVAQIIYHYDKIMNKLPGNYMQGSGRGLI
jgi:hypothetical protein